MKNNKQKILILSDLNKSTSNIIKSSISLANILNADINFFYVKRPIEVIEKESQLSAMRTINRDYLSTDKKIKEIINPISSIYNVNINHTFTFGNIKNEIEKYIDENKPDIIVLGKRKSKMINFFGDNITQFILKKHKGTIVIANDKNTLEPNKELYLGLFDNATIKGNYTEGIINASQKPLTYFKIAKSSNIIEKELSLKDKKTVEYVFEKGDDVIKNI